MLTYADVRDARLGALDEAATAWRALAAGADALEQRAVTELIGPLHTSGWAGDAATALYGRLDEVDDELEFAALRARLVAVVYGEASERLVGVQKRLHAAVDACALLRLTVDERGEAVAPPAEPWHHHDPDGRAERSLQLRNARIYTELIADIVAEANDADAEIKHALDRLQPTERRGMDGFEWTRAVTGAQELATWLGLDPGEIPTDGEPGAVRDWWAGLSADERVVFAMAYPAMVGGLDGIPATDRDRANRTRVQAALGHRADDDERTRKLLDTLEAAEYGPRDRPLLLLGFDEQADGRAIVAVGDPDTAAHTAVLVPGVGTDLGDMPGQIHRAETIQAASAAMIYQGGLDDIAVVAWVDYDAPEVDLSAVGSGRAEAGAPVLDRFVDGLNTSHQGGPGHVTAIGHSYGSTVVGEAASTGDGLGVQDIVVAGSPGMRVDDVDGLQIDPRHVWAGQAEGDAIAGWAGFFVHDNEPSDADFGANRYHVDTEGHSAYWEPDSQSLRNQAAVVVGQYDKVTLDHGSAPG